MKRADIQKAARLYKDFREEKPQKVRRVEFEAPTALTVIGHIKAIEYDTTQAGLMTPYRHTFHKGSKPLLCADKRGQLFIMEGRYKFTYRGIVDLDAKGRELDD